MFGKIQVGSVCEIIKAHPTIAYLVGRECTVVRACHDYCDSDWVISINGERAEWTSPESYLRLKRPPKDEKFERFMEKLKTLVEINEKEAV